MKNEEYIADFCIIAKRTLTTSEFRLFHYHFVEQRSWRPCAEKLGLDRGQFFHNVYQVKRKLAVAFYDTEPYGIFPLDEYFNGSTRSGVRPIALKPQAERSLSSNLRFPEILKRAA